MAGDWIKMRVWLSKDPKVVFMADHLAERREFINWLTDPVQRYCDETAYEHVTRDVTVALCVTSLLITWGTAREQGYRDDDDLIMECCDKEVVSAITGVPGFGDAMEFVGWLIEQDDNSVRFPKFFTEKETPEKKHRTGAAERQRKYRERKRNESATSGVTRNATDVTRDVTRDVTKTSPVTAREEKSRVENIKEPEPVKTGCFVHLLEADLRSTERLHAWLVSQAASDSPVLGDTEHDFRTALVAAEHALSVGENPVALFADNLGKGRLYGNDAADQRAQDRFRQWQKSQRNSPGRDPTIASALATIGGDE